MDAHEKGRIRVTMGRASDFFGPRTLDSAMGERVFGYAIQGKASQILGNPDLPHTQTYIPDVGKALVILGEHDEAMGQVWHIPSPKTVTQREFIELIFAEIGTETKIQVAPKLLLRIMGWFNPTIREVMEMVYEFEEPFILDYSKFEKAFGNHDTSLETAIQTTVKWYQEHYHQNS